MEDISSTLSLDAILKYGINDLCIDVHVLTNSMHYYNLGCHLGAQNNLLDINVYFKRCF